MLDSMNDAIHYLVIDGVPSSDFGVYVTNAGSYNVPKKDHKMESVFGKSGDLYIDNGRFENVEVEYPAFILGDFQKNFDAFVAFLMSKNGYFRLSDTIRPDIFREAVFTGDIKAKVTPEGKQGTLEISFSCKPQKWLKSGEEIITKPNNGIWYINNTTRFPARPLIQVFGHGTLWLNGYSLEVKNIPIGKLQLVGFTRQSTEAPNVPYNLYAYYESDEFQLMNDAHLDARWWVRFSIDNAVAGTITLEERSTDQNCTTTREVDGEGRITIGTILTGDTWFMPNDTDTATKEVVIRVNYKDTSGISTYEDVTIGVEIEVGTSTISLSPVYLTHNGSVTWIKETKQIDSFVVMSTASVLGNPMYVDMETGDAYKYVDDKIVYVNHAIWVGEELPVLNPGKTMIVPDENMTVQIIPRWWTL